VMAVRVNNWAVGTTTLCDSDDLHHALYVTDDGDIHYAVNSFGSSMADAHGMSNTTWHLIVLVHTPGTTTCTIYIDDMSTGNHVATSAAMPTPSGTQGGDRCNLGGNTSGGNGLDGYLGDVMIIEKALSQSEREELATELGFGA
jgi:hypothetical protein